MADVALREATAPHYLVPERMVQASGAGSEFHLGEHAGTLLVLTLGISQTIEQQSLTLSIWGSPDGVNWGSKALLAYPQKFYCGMYSILLNLAKTPDVRYLRAQWIVRKWGRIEKPPAFTFFLYAEASGARIGTAVA